MKTSERILACWVFLLFAAICVYLSPLPWARWLYDEKLAAWVQAFGSIIAIVAAATIALWQTFSQRIREREQEEVAAQITGSSFLLLLNPIIGLLESSNDQLTWLLSGPTKQTAAALGVFAQLEDISHPERADLLILGKVLPECAVQLARGRHLLLQIAYAVKVARRESNPGLVLQAIEGARALLPAAIDQHCQARTRLDAFCK
jgi:hypothetical protein